MCYSHIFSGGEWMDRFRTDPRAGHCFDCSWQSNFAHFKFIQNRKAEQLKSLAKNLQQLYGTALQKTADKARSENA